MNEVAASSFRALDPAMQQALRLAWDSARAGSLGVGAVAVTANGTFVASGRNRLHEVDAGDDALAGTSLAHAEINTLAKLRFGVHEDDGIVLHSTLQPCLQCLGAIRMSPVRRLVVLAPDPLWQGVEAIADVTPFVRRSWPVVEQMAISEWSVFGLLFPTMRVSRSVASTWSSALPQLTRLATEMAGGDLAPVDVVELAASVWLRLGACIDEVAALTR